MIGSLALVEPRDKITIDPAAWDAAVLANEGHLLQSWRWGAFKERFGWVVERVAAPRPGGPALAQVLFRQKAGLSVGYIPRGPVSPPGDPDGFFDLWARIDDVARRRRAVAIVVEPDRAIPVQSLARVRLHPGPDPIQPSRSVKVALLDDQSLLDQMHPKTRYNVRMALRRGVTSRVGNDVDTSVSEFYTLLQDTASRNAFNVHAPDYYRGFVRQFGLDAIVIFAEIEGRAVAGVIAVTFGEEAIYMYGASSTKDRAHGAGFLLQYEVMRWARDRGARRYDLWGIPEQDPRSTAKETGDRLSGTTENDWRGLFEFKTRFGGEIIRYPRPMERRYHPLLASLARRFYSPGGSG